MKLPNNAIERIVQEMSDADLGDERRTQRLLQLMAKMAKSPRASLPAALGTDAELQAAYRFMNNDAIDFDALNEPHVEGTAKRANAAGDVLVLHDTTDCSFPHLSAEEVGYLQSGKAGFRLHLSVVVDAQRWRRPLGVIHAEAMFRAKRSRVNWKNKGSGSHTVNDPDKEFRRWWDGVEASAERLSGCRKVIHVMDREGDSYELMSQMLEADLRFITRVRVNRRGRVAKSGSQEWSTVQEVAKCCEGVLERVVPLSRRQGKTTPASNVTHPPRKMRLAKLRFSAVELVIPTPNYLRGQVPSELKLNLVHVLEIDPPKGQQPVEWLLYTTEPTTNAAQVADIVDKYRDRWLIEEFNAALKSGCAFEAREFETRHALLNMLALSLPVATEILALRSRARTEPNSPAADVLSSVQLKVLRAVGERKLSAKPTVEEALLAVAGLGGHLKRNGPPGWKVLHRGMTNLLQYEIGWVAREKSGKK